MIEIRRLCNQAPTLEASNATRLDDSIACGHSCKFLIDHFVDDSCSSRLLHHRIIGSISGSRVQHGDQRDTKSDRICEICMYTSLGVILISAACLSIAIMPICNVTLSSIDGQWLEYNSCMIAICKDSGQERT